MPVHQPSDFNSQSLSTPNATRLGVIITSLSFLFGCLFLSWVIIHPFLEALLWALILAYITWPLHVRLCHLLRHRNELVATLLTAILALMAIFVLGWIGWQLQIEISSFVRQNYSANNAGMEEIFSRIPRGEWLKDRWRQWLHQPPQFQQYFWNVFKQYSHQLLKVLHDLERNLLVFLFTFLSLFFIYRDGDRLLRQTYLTLYGLMGEKSIPYLHQIGLTLKAVIYGLVLTALGQGLMAAIGFWMVGLGAPLLLGLVTAMVALIPFAAPLIWGAASLWVIFLGKFWAGVGLFAWGVLVMLAVDNFIRPLVISQATQIHFLVVLFGVLGGIEWFGLLGLFIGPVILSVTVAIWQEWVQGISAENLPIPLKPEKPPSKNNQ